MGFVYRSALKNCDSTQYDLRQCVLDTAEQFLESDPTVRVYKKQFSHGACARSIVFLYCILFSSQDLEWSANNAGNHGMTT